MWIFLGKNTTPTRVTAENIDQFTIHDVVLPTPGHDVILPDCDVIASKYTELLKEDGLTMEAFKNKIK